MNDLTKTERMGMFKDFMGKYLDSDILTPLLDDLNLIGFFTAPASTKYHGNYEGGLFDHSYEVAKSLVELTEKLDLKWGMERSPYVVGMFHDLCKCDQYKRNFDGTWGYNSNLTLTGHGDKSVIVAQHIFNYHLTEEEILCIRWHMGAYDDKSVWNNLGAAIEMYPNVLWTHTADMIATRIKRV